MIDEPKLGSFRPAENLPPLSQDEAPKELVAEPSSDLVAKYKLFQQATGAKTDVVYYPCSAADSSPSVAFPNSRVIYVELDSGSVEALKKTGFEVYNASALEYDPGNVDVLILLNPTIKPDIPSKHVVPGGFTICNDYHGTASRLRGDPNWELKGVIVPISEGKFKFDTEGLEDYWKEVETDDEWKNARFSWGAQSYEEVVRIVEEETGKRENILENYVRIIKEAISQGKGAIIHDEGETSLVSFEGKVLLLGALPKKKGAVDDLFIFQRKALSSK